MQTTFFNDPTVIGPGIWFNMHTTAVHATTDQLKEAFIVYINALCDNFRCQTCRVHFRKFIDTRPLKEYWAIKDNNGNDIGFFKWTWELHNQVNKFLKKYQPSLEEAYTYYSDNSVGVCRTCGGMNKQNTEQPTTNNTISSQEQSAVSKFQQKLTLAELMMKPQTTQYRGQNTSIKSPIISHLNDGITRPISQVLSLSKPGDNSLSETPKFRLISR